jgi:hypothetical protein
MDSPTMLSPSSSPHTPDKMSKKGDENGRKILTFKDESVIHVPDIVISPWNWTKFKKYPAWAIGENTDWMGVVSVPIFLCRFSVEFAPVPARRCRKMVVKVRVLRECESSAGVEPNEVPENFLQLCIVSEHLWHRNQIPRNLTGLCLRRTRVGRGSLRFFKIWNWITFDSGSSYRFVSEGINEKQDDEARAQPHLFGFFLILLLCHLHTFLDRFDVIAIHKSPI